MESLKQTTAPHVLLFWSVPSISKVHEYKIKSEKLNQAMNSLIPIEIITYDDASIKFEKIGIESGMFFGWKKLKGKMKKILLNINS